jgi:hypothetical protein
MIAFRTTVKSIWLKPPKVIGDPMDAASTLFFG